LLDTVFAHRKAIGKESAAAAAAGPAMCRLRRTVRKSPTIETIL